MIPIIYIFYGQYSWLGFCQMLEKNKFFIEEPGPELSVFERGEYAVNFHDSYQKNNELLSRLAAEQRECRVELIESSTGRISWDKLVSMIP